MLASLHERRPWAVRRPHAASPPRAFTQQPLEHVVDDHYAAPHSDMAASAVAESHLARRRGTAASPSARSHTEQASASRAPRAPTLAAPQHRGPLAGLRRPVIHARHLVRVQWQALERAYRLEVRQWQQALRQRERLLGTLLSLEKRLAKLASSRAANG
jgi:hypothetical protein